GEAFIDLYGFQRCCLGLWQRLVWRYGAASIRRAQKIISVGHATVSQREVRIFFNCLLKVFERLLQTVFGSFVVIEAAFQLKLIGFVAFGVMLRQSALLARDLEFQGVDDLARNLSLRGQ